MIRVVDGGIQPCSWWTSRLPPRVVRDLGIRGFDEHSGSTEYHPCGPAPKPAKPRHRTTIVCGVAVVIRPSACLLYTAPGPIARGPRLRLTDMRWSDWGAPVATARAFVQHVGGRAPVRVRAGLRARAAVGYFYGQVVVISETGAEQLISLDSTGETA
ncbi:MAG TPA: hypothetical protein VLK58_14070 [Conexibacter sp.]|nr:hypothetical protein [Conexibacter sp.]